VLAAEGYPGKVTKGDAITGLDSLREWSSGMVFHAATARRGGETITDGGRVLGVTALGGSLREAVDEAYRAVGMIHWRGMQYRKDIGARALGRAW